MSAPALLRVVSFNIRNGIALDGRNCWWRRRAATLATLQRLGGDVVGLQEAYGFQLRWLDDRLPEVDSVGVGRTDGQARGEHCPVLIDRGTFEQVEVRSRWFSSAPDEPGSRLPGSRFPRVVTMTHLRDRTTGATFGVANLHLDERNDDNRVESVRLLTTWLDRQLPWIVLGDLNTPPHGNAIEVLRSAGFEAALPDDAPGSNHDFTGRTDGRRIDHVLVTPEFAVTAWGVDTERWRGRLPSDHWPVWADLNLAT